MGKYMEIVKRIMAEMEAQEELGRVVFLRSLPPPLPLELDPDLPGLSEAERNFRLARLYSSGRVIENTVTNRLEIHYLDDRWIIEGRAPSPGTLRIYTAWLEEFDPIYVLVRTPKGSYYAHHADVERYGERNQDKHGVYYSLPRARWHRADIPRPQGPGGTP